MCEFHIYYSFTIPGVMITNVKFSHALHVLNMFLLYILHLNNAQENKYFMKMSL